METSSILLILASCFALAFGLLGLSWLFERGLDRWRSQRAVDRTGGRSPIGRIFAEGIPFLEGLSKVTLRFTPFDLFVKGMVGEVRRLGYRTDLVPMGTVLLASSGFAFLFVYVISLSVIGALASVVCVFLMLNAWVNKRNEQRREEMREQIPEALQSMKACFQTGYSLPQTVHEVAEHTRGRLASFSLRLREISKLVVGFIKLWLSCGLNILSRNWHFWQHRWRFSIKLAAVCSGYWRRLVSRSAMSWN